MANGHGGKREGAGKPAGSKNVATLSKEDARQVLRERVMRDLEPMVRAQIDHARGLTHMMLRQKDGTFKRAEKPDEIEAALNSGDSSNYYIYTAVPSVAAFTDLMNRALDKPKEQAQEHDVQARVVIQWADK